jgi:hypothetical protein
VKRIHDHSPIIDVFFVQIFFFFIFLFSIERKERKLMENKRREKKLLIVKILMVKKTTILVSMRSFQREKFDGDIFKIYLVEKNKLRFGEFYDFRLVFLFIYDFLLF